MAQALNAFNTRKYKKSNQFIISIGLVILVAVICYLASSFIAYKTVALILLVTVSIIAMLFDILPVLTASVLSALIWNFFFIPPIFTFHIYDTEDVLMFLLYFFIALVNAVLTFKIRKEESKTRDKEEKEKTILLYNTLLNSLSHELRTPISTILGAIDTIKDNTKISAENQLELLNQIDIASVRLNRQVENLLNMSRLETGILKPNMDWSDINELIHSVIHKIHDSQNHIIHFEPTETLPLFKFDRGLIQQVLDNLIHNAIHYTPPDSTIKISAAHLSDHCVITIEDNGNGIAEKEIPFLFNKFYRVPQTKVGGSGLGLSIAKGFVESHNGTITAHNNDKGGATFTLSLPLEVSYINNLKNE